MKDAEDRRRSDMTFAVQQLLPDWSVLFLSPHPRFYPDRGDVDAWIATATTPDGRRIKHFTAADNAEELADRLRRAALSPAYQPEPLPADAIRVGFLQDFSHDNADDRRQAIEEIERNIHRRVRLAGWVDREDQLGRLPEVDLLVVDYGGLHHAYGDAISRYGNSVRRWAEEHPGRLVILWTGFTAECYRAVFEDAAADLDNIVMKYGGAWDFKVSPDLWPKTKAWLEATA